MSWQVSKIVSFTNFIYGPLLVQFNVQTNNTNIAYKRMKLRKTQPSCKVTYSVHNLQ